MKIGLIAGGYKPLHRGHFCMIQMAAAECSTVRVFASKSDRCRKGERSISGHDMVMLWDRTYRNIMPSNVRVTFSEQSPIRDVWDALGNPDEGCSYTVYSDPTDLTHNFPNDRLLRYCPKLLDEGRVHLKAVDRTSTVDVSGTMMRRLLDEGDRVGFTAMLPDGVDCDLIWNTLLGT